MTNPPLLIDGATGEGGGQILRTSLALSLHLKRPIHLINIRRRRQRPGLRRQHLTCILAAAEISNASFQGAEIGSMEIQFDPGPLRPGKYRFDIGSAGSTTLLLQAILPPLLLAPGPSYLTLRGGTHNPKAPPFDFLDQVLVPQLRAMGANIQLSLERPGFYPQGGGILHAMIEPAAQLRPLNLCQRGKLIHLLARALVASLPRHIGEREITLLARHFNLQPTQCQIETLTDCGIGNVVTVTLICEHITELFAGFGERGVSAEQVARNLAREVQAYLQAEVPVGPYLADQLLVPMALAGGGRFRTLPPSNHTLTNVKIIETFVDARFKIEQEAQSCWQIRL